METPFYLSTILLEHHSLEAPFYLYLNTNLLYCSPILLEHHSMEAPILIHSKSPRKEGGPFSRSSLLCRWTHFTFILKAPGRWSPGPVSCEGKHIFIYSKVPERRVDPSPGPVSCAGGHIFIYSEVPGRRVDPSPGPVSCVGGHIFIYSEVPGRRVDPSLGPVACEQ